MNELEKFSSIKSFIFDVDGVFTNSELIILENGRLLRKMNTRDGYAVKRAIEKGYHICIITGGNSSGVTERLEGLGIKHIYSGVKDKVEVLENHINKHQLNTSSCLYMGDDIPDLDAMKIVALPCCPYDAAWEIKNISVYISHQKGGHGCVRDVIEKVLKLNNDWLDDPKDIPLEIEDKI